MKTPIIALSIITLIILLVACGGSAPPSTPVAPLSTTSVPLPSATPTPVPLTPTVALRPTDTAPAAPPSEILLEIAEGSEASYVVREQLARVSFPSDAIGVTKDIKGSIVMEPGNTIQAGRSKITVDLTTLKSDEDRRDRYIKANTLQTNRFPTAEFILREVRGLTSPLPHTGEAQFQALGDMTIHGVTKPLTWDVSASFAEKEITGRATTSFQFGDFGMTVPRVLVVLSVEDKIQLVINFRLSRTG